MEQTFLRKTYVQALLALVLVGVVAALAAYVHLTLREAAYMHSGPTMISVRGEGEVLAKPDIGRFTFAVVSEAADAASAQQQSASAANDIIAYLEGLGVNADDIKTTAYNLNPQYRYESRNCVVGQSCPPGERILDGYEVNQTLSVKVRDLDMAGDLIAGVGERGATNISGLQFTIDDESELAAQARAAAIADAQEKADQLVADLGVRIVRMTGFYEEYMYPQPYGYGGDMMERSMMSADDGGAPSLPTGENEITRTVNITYEVR